MSRNWPLFARAPSYSCPTQTKHTRLTLLFLSSLQSVNKSSATYMIALEPGERIVSQGPNEQSTYRRTFHLLRGRGSSSAHSVETRIFFLGFEERYESPLPREKELLKTDVLRGLRRGESWCITAGGSANDT